MGLGLKRPVRELTMSSSSSESLEEDSSRLAKIESDLSDQRESQIDRAKMTEAMIRKKPGMASVKDMPLLQDGPPPGGFAPVRYARRISNTGPSAMAIFLTVSGAFAWGMYQVGQGNKIRRALKEEKYAARRAILPILQAEEDERFVSEWKKYLDYEADVMKDVPGWKVGENVYNSGRWMPPATGELRPDVW